MVRVSANFNIPRTDVYENVVRMHRETGSFNKLLTTLINVYHDNPDVANLVDGVMSGVTKRDSAALDGLLSRMKATIAQSDSLTEEGQFSSDVYKDEVKTGYEEVTGAPLAGNGEVQSEIADLRKSLDEIKELLKGVLGGGTGSNEAGKQAGGTSPEGDTAPTIVDERVNDTTPVIVEDSATEPIIEEEVEDTAPIIVDGDSSAGGILDDDESDSLMESLLSSGVFK